MKEKNKRRASDDTRKEKRGNETNRLTREWKEVQGPEAQQVGWWVAAKEGEEASKDRLEGL
jgi:hypothetical protein